MSRLIQATCLRPHYSLRYQLFVSFGVTSAIAIGVVVCVATLTAKSSGDYVKKEASCLLQEQVITNTRSSSDHAAMTLSRHFENMESIMKVLAETTQDRIVGYPEEGWEEDKFVPFYDTVTGKNIYPFIVDPLPPDWNITVNVNETNYQEHVQDRWPWYKNVPVSTKSAASRIQGQCDPSEIDPSSITYYENCTEANNDYRTGGVVQPTPTNRYLAEKSAALHVVLKSYYETVSVVKNLGIYFANSGAGSSLVYPGYIIDGTSSFTSVGCDWMRQINTVTQLPYGTDDEIKRCHKNGDRVPGREYNPLEREWCREQALDPGGIKVVGPYRDAFDPSLWLLGIGKALFDRRTGHFLGCTLLDVSVERLSHMLNNTRTDETTDFAMVRWDDGTVVYSNNWDTSQEDRTIHIADLDICDPGIYDRMRSLVDFNKPWEPEEVEKMFVENSFSRDGKFVSAFPIPVLPSKYDPAYHPVFLVMQCEGEDIYSLIDQMEVMIDEDVTSLYVTTIIIGVFGIGVVLLVSWIVAVFLTRPLNWMMDVAKQIVHHSNDKAIGSIYGNGEKPLLRCTPKTEIMDLVSEFQSITEGFSGDGPATVASPGVYEIVNKVSWKSQFRQEYLEQLFQKPEEEEEEEEEIDHLNREVSPTVESQTSNEGTEIEEIGDNDNENGKRERGSEPFCLEQEPTFASAVNTQILSIEHLEVNSDACENLEEEKQEEVPTPQNTNAEPAEELLTSQNTEAKLSEKSDRHLSPCSADNRKNLGPVAYIAVEEGAGRFDSELRTSLNHNQILHSKLFWWIVVLIVAPVLITMTAICTHVTVNVTSIFPSWLEDVEVASVTLASESVISTATTYATLAEEIFEEPISDLHFLTRVVGWLLFGAVKQADTFTEMTQGTEECKTFPSNGSCPFFSDERAEYRAPCDCRWEDSHAESCSIYDNPRNLQKQFYAGQAQDADPITGARQSTSYDKVDYSPATTLWWNDTSSMPGASNNTGVQGYATTYDRTRLMSAVAVATVPIYNYRRGSFQKHLGMYVGFEADGMLAGYTGCGYSFTGYSHFKSTDKNGAALVSPTLCPLGKFGYDARCRGWYDKGKESGTLHLTAPYVFAGTGEVANSITFPLVDPSSGEHVGQTLVDFFPNGISEIQNEDHDDHDDHDEHGGETMHFHNILVTPTVDALGGDTLVGPGYSMGSTSPPIQELLLPCDKELSENRELFKTNVLKPMKDGISGNSTFRRTVFKGHYEPEDYDSDKLLCGDVEERIFISYEPVKIRALHPVRSDDFARGVNVSEIVMGSFGTFVATGDLTRSYALIEDQARSDIDGSTALLIGMIAATATLTIVVLTMITISIVRPVTILLEFVRLINKKQTLHDIPPMQGGSREVNQVYASLSKLHKIVRFSNIAFFSGKMRSAHKNLTDALSLFRRAGDQKAVGIAANNLGNTIVAIRNQTLSTNRCVRIDGNCLHEQALRFYDESIGTAMKEYEEILGTDNYDLRARLGEQLANRYFNRGLFFLLTARDACAAEDFAERGREDLLKARALDAEVRGIWVETRQVHNNSVRYFERLLRRANGLIGLLQKNSIEIESCNIAELLDEADSLLFVVWNVPSSPLFEAMSPTGRLQQLEGTAVRYSLCRGNAKEAARISQRMLVEDEFIAEPAFSAAASAMLAWFRETPPPKHLRSSELEIHRFFRRMLKNCKTSSDIAIGKNVIYLQDLASHNDCEYILQGFSDRIYDSCHEDDFVVIPHPDRLDTDALLLQRKSDMEKADCASVCRRISDINSIFRRAIRIVLESEDARENDTWVIVATDRGRWDPVKCTLAESHHYLLSEISQLKKTQNAAIHVAIVTVGADGHMSEICSELCRLSRESMYIDVKEIPNGFDDALTEVASLVIGGGKKSSSIPSGITMEQF